MKAITIPTSLYVALAQLEDKDAGQIAKAIARYVEEEKEPAFSNSLLKAFFTLFREQIDAQRNAYEQRRVVNTQNAQRKVSKNESYRRRPNRLLKRRKRKLFLTLQFLCSDWLMSIRKSVLIRGNFKMLGILWRILISSVP